MPAGLYHMYPLGQKDGINMTESAAQPLYKYIKDDIVRQIKDGIYSRISVSRQSAISASSTAQRV